MQQETVTLIVAIAGICGTLAGAIVGPEATSRKENKKWLRDIRMQEYRELLDAFTVAHLSLLRIRHQAEIHEGKQADFDPVPSDNEMESYRVLRNRLFTATALEQENVRYRWANAIENYKRTQDDREFADRFDSICATVTWLAAGVGPRPRAVP